MTSTLKRSAMALLLCVAMVSMMAACGTPTAAPATKAPATEAPQESAAAEATPEAPAAPEPITLTFLSPESGTARWNNLHNTPIQQEILKKTGVTLEVTDCDDAKFQVILAGGDLPDFVRTPTKYHKQLIEGGNVIELDSLLASNGANIAKLSFMLKMSASQWSNGTGKTYFVAPEVVVVPGGEIFQTGIGPTLRWDYYKEIGAPKIATYDDLLNALKQMQDKHPKTEAGNKVYGVSAWTDWNGWQYIFPTVAFHRTRYLGASTSVGYDMVNGEFKDLLNDPASALWQSVEYYYKANKMGILDPDSLTQKFDDFTAKGTAGQLLSAPSNWSIGDFNGQNGDKGLGFMVVPVENGMAWYGSAVGIGWTDRTIGISKNCKTPDRAMDFLNYLYSEEGSFTLKNGVQGQHWDLVDGKPKLNDEVLKLETAGGEAYENAVGFINFNDALIGLNGLSPTYDVPFDLSNDPALFKAQNNALTSDFCAFYQVEYPAQVFANMVKENRATNQDSGAGGIEEGIIAKPADDITRMEAKLLDLMQKAAAKCILATGDEEFQALKAQAIADFKAAGSEQVVAAYKALWDDAAKIVADAKAGN